MGIWYLFWYQALGKGLYHYSSSALLLWRNLFTTFLCLSFIWAKIWFYCPPFIWKVELRKHQKTECCICTPIFHYRSLKYLSVLEATFQNDTWSWRGFLLSSTKCQNRFFFSNSKMLILVRKPWKMTLNKKWNVLDTAEGARWSSPKTSTERLPEEPENTH